MEDGQVKLNLISTLSDCLLSVLSKTSTCVQIRQNTGTCRDKWKSFISLLRVSFALFLFNCF